MILTFNLNCRVTNDLLHAYGHFYTSRMIQTLLYNWLNITKHFISPLRICMIMLCMFDILQATPPGQNINHKQFLSTLRAQENLFHLTNCSIVQLLLLS